MQPAVRVSVCIVTYNQEAYIEDAVLSVLAQAGEFELEVLVGDDASTDRTGELVDALARAHPGRVIAVRRPANLGPIENYQDLVRRASGQFVAHLDGDDAWLPGKLRAQLAFLAAHPECPAVYANAISVDGAGRLMGLFTNGHPPLLDLRYLCERGNFLMHSSLLYRAEVRHEFADMVPPAIDYRIHLALARHGPLGFIDEPLALYRAGTATSLVRTSSSWVQRQLWAALKEGAKRLPADQRRAAIGYCVAATLLGGRAAGDLPLATVLREGAQECGCSQPALLLAAVGPLFALLRHGVAKRLLKSARATERLAQHYRV